MTPENFEDIKSAINLLLANPNLKRIDGNGWLVYIVSNAIRVDISIASNRKREV